MRVIHVEFFKLHLVPNLIIIKNLLIKKIG